MKKEKYKPKYYDPKEEKINILTHGIGLVASVVGLVLLVVKSMPVENIWQLISFSIFGLSLITLYAASTFYHSAKELALRTKLNIFDHAAIYVLIAGTYTPYALVTLHGETGWWIFGTIWTLALIGVLLKLFFTGRFDKLSTVMYVLMGWIMVFAIKPMKENLAEEGGYWLVAGGLLYTVGAILYSIPKMKYNHAIFHVFVLLGSVAHFISIYGYVQ